MKKIVSIIGARPQFIKAATVSREFRKYPDVEEILVHTGQHYDENMSEVFFKEMQIPEPKYNLGVNNMTHGAMTGRMIEQIEKVLIDEKPDMVIVFGDTNSTLAGALAAKKLLLPLAHVESGLRSFNMRMPEEINRIVTDRIADLLYCPSQIALKNLKKEGFYQFNSEVVFTGDVMYDAALFYSHQSEQKSGIMKSLQPDAGNFILCTLHREENTDDSRRLSSVMKAIDTLTKDYRVIIPLHPRTQKILQHQKIQIRADIIDPVGYFDMLELIKNCRMVMTDSGGLQKEAYFFKKFCITLRDETEWKELVDAGVNFIAGADTSSILETFSQVIRQDFPFMETLYGEGKAAGKICEHIMQSKFLNS